jgi:hypothetical protein
VEGEVAGFTKPLSFENEIAVAVEEPIREGELQERAHIYVENDGARNAVYEIKQVRPGEGGAYALSIGDKTPIRQFANDADLSSGYVYDIAEGASFRIPLTATWISPAALLDGMRERIGNEETSGHMSGVFADQLLYRLNMIELLADQGNSATAIAYMRDFLAYIGDPSVQQQGLISSAATAALEAAANKYISL